MISTHLLSDIAFVRDLNAKKRIKPPSTSISKFIQKTRVMPPESPIPGPVDLSITPWIVEWLENMSPASPIQHQAIKKAAQIAATFAVENAIAYYMKEQPCGILYISATHALLEKWTKRLEPMIDSCGIRELIIQNAAESFGSKSRRTGDKVFQKLFIAGWLEMASAQSPASQRSDSVRFLIRDETEGAPKEVKTGEGNYLKISFARTKFFGDRKKVFDLSTPAEAEDSYIDPAFEEGDQRLYMVKCPMCNKPQPLQPIPDEGSCGLRADTKAGKIESVYYLCDFCHDAFFERSKPEMYKTSFWEPTSISKSPYYRSYYINSLYAPIGTFSWFDYYNDFLDSKISPANEKAFTNLTAGLSYREKGERPKFNQVNHLRGNYDRMTVPDGVLFLTVAIDVQRGSSKFEKMSDNEINEYRKKNPTKKEKYPRLEMEILGHGAGWRSWSINYIVFNGKLEKIEEGAWGKLREFYSNLAEKSGLVVDGQKMYSIKRDDGFEFDLPINFIDARDGEMTSIVTSFCQSMGTGFFPSMGHNKKDTISKKGDIESALDIRKYKPVLLDKSQYTYIISTNHYKKLIYMRAKIDRPAAGENKPGFMDHPKTYDDNYFKMLFAEEQMTDGSFDAGGRANEALDLRVYNLCAGDVYLASLIELERAFHVKNGMSHIEAKTKIDTRHVLQILEKRAARK
jgi:phage terminase large subunit GpA-like protein